MPSPELSKGPSERSPPLSLIKKLICRSETAAAANGSKTARNDRNFVLLYSDTKKPQNDRSAQRDGQRSGPELLPEQQRGPQEHAGADHIRE